MQSDGIKRLLLQGPRLDHAPSLVDLRARDPVGWLLRPFRMLRGPPRQMVRIVAKPSFRDGDFVEIVVPQARLRRELGGYLLGLIAVTAFIGAVAGVLVYLSLNLFLVRPMQRITASMERFRANPDDPAARILPSNRRDELGRARPSSTACRPTCAPPSAPAPAWRRSARRWPRSTTTCATC